MNSLVKIKSLLKKESIINIMNEQQLQVIKGLKRNNEKYGKPFCPCLAPYLYEEENSDDYICPCKEYRDTGFCHCGLH